MDMGYERELLCPLLTPIPATATFSSFLFPTPLLEKRVFYISSPSLPWRSWPPPPNPPAPNPLPLVCHHKVRARC